jgi:hypothetical protein
MPRGTIHGPSIACGSPGPLASVTRGTTRRELLERSNDGKAYEVGKIWRVSATGLEGGAFS